MPSHTQAASKEGRTRSESHTSSTNPPENVRAGKLPEAGPSKSAAPPSASTSKTPILSSLFRNAQPSDRADLSTTELLDGVISDANELSTRSVHTMSRHKLQILVAAFQSLLVRATESDMAHLEELLKSTENKNKTLSTTMASKENERRQAVQDYKTMSREKTQTEEALKKATARGDKLQESLEEAESLLETWKEKGNAIKDLAKGLP